MSKNTRLDPKERKQQILHEAISLAAEVGYNNIRRDAIAARLGVATGLVTKYFNTMEQLKRDVMRHAVRLRILPVVAQGIADRNPHALEADQALRDEAIATLSTEPA